MSLLLKRVFLIALLSTATQITVAAQVQIKTPSWAVVNNEGALIAGENYNKPRPIASITKLMMAMTYLDKSPEMSKKERITEDDVDKVKKSSSRLKVGFELRRSDLMRLALASSENRAASALARSYPGGLRAMVADMNEKARRLKLTKAHFVDATGLSPQNVATAKEVALMVIVAKAYPAMREAAKLHDYEQHVEMENDPLDLSYKNTNKPLREGKVNPLVSKTGYIKEAGKCLSWVMGSTKGKVVGLALLGASSFIQRDKDEINLSEWVTKKGLIN